MASMKAHDTIRTEALRSIKGAFMVWEVAPDNIGKELTNEIEISLIRKLVKINQDTIDTCNDGKHDEIVNDAKAKNTILGEFLPQPASTEDITRMFLHVRENEQVEPIKKNMGVFVKRIKELLPNADGKAISDVLKNELA